MHFLEAFSLKVHGQVEFLLGTQIKPGSPSTAVCICFCPWRSLGSILSKWQWQVAMCSFTPLLFKHSQMRIKTQTYNLIIRIILFNFTFPLFSTTRLMRLLRQSPTLSSLFRILNLAATSVWFYRKVDIIHSVRLESLCTVPRIGGWTILL